MNHTPTPTATRPRWTALAVTLVATLVVLTTVAPAFAAASAIQTGSFSVAIDRTNSPVTEGDALEVTASVENTARETGTQTVSLRLAGRVVDSTETTLGGGETATVTLAWETGSGDADSYTAAVATANDTAETDVVVEEPESAGGDDGSSAANFAVAIDATNSPVTKGDALAVTTTVENTGDEMDTQVVSLRVGAAGAVDSTRLTLAPSENRTVTISWQTRDGDAGSYTASVATANDTAERDVEVREADATGDASPPNLAVTLGETTAPVTEGDALEVTATVGNTGDKMDTQVVSLRVGAAGAVDSTRLTLAPSENRTVTLTWETAEGDAGTYTAAVATANDTAERDVEVREPSGTDGTNDPPTVAVDYEPASPGVGDEVVLTADASDPDGNITTYRWTVDDEVVSTDASFARTFEEPGEHEVTVRVTDDGGTSTTETVTVTVESANEPPTVSVSVEPSSPTAGEEVSLRADASDPDGEVASYEWVVDGEVVSGASSGASLTYTFGEAGLQEVQLRVTDDDGAAATATTTVEVSAAGPPATATDADGGGPTDVPGFGWVVALAAVVASGLASARRRG